MHQSFTTIRFAPLGCLGIWMVFAVYLPMTTYAQSGTTPNSSRDQGSGKTAAQEEPAMEGYCPVCILEMKKWVKGDPRFVSTFDGQRYLFPGEEQKKMFDAEPVKYAPVLGGDCIVAFKKMAKRVPGDNRYSAVHQDRLFLFSNEMAKDEFLKSSEVYASADVALDGRCPVCRVEMDQVVEGNSEIAVVHQGLRYFFPDEKQRKMFIANPEKYAVSATTPTSPAGKEPGSGSSGK